MPDELPMACSLSADELPRRLDAIRALGATSLVSVDPAPAGTTLRFRADARQPLEAIVAGEGECCAFLDLHLAEDGDAIVLTITAPAEAEPVIDDLVAAFASGTRLAGFRAVETSVESPP
jgi:hypothetical protein